MVEHYRISVDVTCDLEQARELMYKIEGPLYDIVHRGRVQIERVDRYELENDVVFKHIMIDARTY